MNKKSTIFLFVLLFTATVFFEQNASAGSVAKNSVPAHAIAFGNNFDFTAKLSIDSKVILKWNNADSLNTSHFIVQRSLDGINYDDAVVIFVPEDNAIKRYSYADKINSFSNKLIYYRLKIADGNGKYKYSDTVIISLEKQEGQII